MSAPIHHLKKSEIVYLATHYCKHRHSFLQHYQCYIRENPEKERIGFIDIETTNLNASLGIILSYCIKKLGGKILSGVIRKEDILRGSSAGKEDKRLIQQLLNDLRNFDRIIGFYSQRFDIPYIRTRALSCGLDFPNYGTLKHTDMYFIVKSRLKLHSNKLAVVAQTILGKTEKTHIDSKYWRGAQRGDERSLDYILRHNKADVRDLERIYLKLLPFFRKTNTSV